MRDLHSLQVRLAHSATLDAFCAFFEYHGALGTRRGTDQAWAPVDVLSFVPLAFGLLPSEAVIRDKPDLRIKPSIRMYLRHLGVPESERLVDILKSTADQYYRTADSILRRKKLGISDIRAMPHLYRKLRGSQNNRCSVCGASFRTGATETLDHVVPWRLIGDVPDGSNYQLLCEICNLGKREMLTVFQSPRAHNWIYGRNGTEFEAESRFVALALARHCAVDNCNATVSTAEMFVQRHSDRGLAVVDNATVLCELHCADVS